MLRDYFTGGFDVSDLTKGTKTNGDGPILPGDDARDFSDEDSLADDEGDAEERMEEDDIQILMQEGQMKPEEEDDEDRMSVDLFGPDMSSQAAGQHFGADTLIALLGGRDTNEENGLPWSDEPHDGMFDDLSPTGNRAQPEEEVETPESEMVEEHKEPTRSAAELIKEWFPQFSPNEILKFTEIFGAKPAELNQPLAKVPRGITLTECTYSSLCPC